MNDDEILAVAREGFLSEAQDMLAQFEQCLLVMESDPSDHENLNAAFRAAHTIKGTAGLFGFEAVVSFTHEVETLMEALRAGERALDEAIVAALLDSRDQMTALLDEVGSGTADPAIAERSRTLGHRLRALRGAPDTARSDAAAPAAADAPAEPALSSGLWHLSLRFGPDALRAGLDPLSFIRYLATLGTVRHIATLTDAVPLLDALDPENCHLGFEIAFESAADQAAIVQVFEFAAEDAEIAVLAPDAPASAYAALLAQRAGADAQASDALLALWALQGVVLPLREGGDEPAGADEPLRVERRAESTDRRQNPDERRTGSRDRRGDEHRYIRVRADKLDRLIDLIGELVIAGSGANLVAQQLNAPAMIEAGLRLTGLVEEARDQALGLRMVPIGETFARFQRVVRDVSKSLGKDVELEISGGDTELDKSMVETIADPLTHLVRNSLDHGIESAEERLAAGKPARGRLALAAHHEAGSIVIEVSDDGKGLNRDRILAKAVERGLVPEGIELSEEEVFRLIFAPGFSTAEQVTDISGRGVGMDVVKRNIEALRGQISLASQLGRGTTTQIRLPLTLAMIDGFLTAVGGTFFVLPLAVVSECIDVPPECLRQPEQVCGVFDLRGQVLPYLDLGRFYDAPAAGPGARRSLVVVRDGGTRLGIVVDRLHGEHQTVIKPLSSIFRHLKAISGSTILGSGDVALVLDVPGLMSRAIQSTQGRRMAPVTPR